MRPYLQNLQMVNITIIIVSYNTKILTLQCIKSIITSVKQLKYEIIIVDNGSTDGSAIAIRKFQIPNSKFQIKLIENEENLGFARANNQGIKVAKGSYILLLNSDTKVKEESLEELVNFAKRTPDAGVVGPRLLNADGSVQPSVFRFPTIGRAVSQYWLGKQEQLDKYYPEGDQPIGVDSIVGASFLITPVALEKVGGLDERYFMFYEDLDYCRKVRARGLKVYYLPSSEIVHYHGASGKKIKDGANQWRRLIPSSKIYHGSLKHYLLNFIIWTGQKFVKLGVF